VDVVVFNLLQWFKVKTMNILRTGIIDDAKRLPNFQLPSAEKSFRK